MYPSMTLAGYCGRAPEAQVLTSGRVKTSFRLAQTPRRQRDGEWVDDDTIWFTVECWGRLAEHVCESVRLGDPLVVTGRLKAERWDQGDGPRERKLVVAEHIGLDLVFGTGVLHRKKRDAAPDAEAGMRAELSAADPDDDDELTAADIAGESMEPAVPV